jgi:NTE family protein
MKAKRALVLSGGGARGALQVGAVRALYETGYAPDILAGTSIGAANSAFLAANGFNQSGIDRLQSIWEATVDKDLLPTDLWWQIMRALLKRNKGVSLDKIRDLAVANGLTPDLRFGDLADIELYLVASDLDANGPIVFGRDPDETVLDCMLASMALPPWIAPVQRDGHILIDGGAVSHLPIEAALQQGATEIIALDLCASPNESKPKRIIAAMLHMLDCTVETRAKILELELAQARGVPVKYIELSAENSVPIWDFRHSPDLIQRGYHLTVQAIESWQFAPFAARQDEHKIEEFFMSILEVLE